MTTIVLTGQVHIGKTTVCRKVANEAAQHGYRVRGILSLPLLDESGAYLGIEVLDLESGARRELARVDRSRGGPHVGSYYFDSAALQWGQDVVMRAIAIGCDLLIVDEIGRLELEQNTGFYRVLDVLAAGVVPRSLFVVRTALLDAFHRRLPELKFIAYEVREDNRDMLPLQIIQQLFPLHAPSAVNG